MLAAIWIAGAFLMLMRLVSRIRRERREAQVPAPLSDCGLTYNFVADGIPVSFGDRHPSPTVRGILYPRILLPIGIDRLLNPREFHAVLIHELAHARRRDNLLRLLYEISLCVLWFHPLIWLAGARIALYRELSCDESVIRRAHGKHLFQRWPNLQSRNKRVLASNSVIASELSLGAPGRAGTNDIPRSKPSTDIPVCRGYRGRHL